MRYQVGTECLFLTNSLLLACFHVLLEHLGIRPECVSLLLIKSAAKIQG